MTAILATLSRMSNQIPMSWARSAIGRLTSHTNLSESIRISKMLLASAKNGASGNAATKMVMKPNWRTVKNNLTWQLWVLSSGILRLSINTPNKMKTAVGLGLKEHPIHTINSSLLSYAFGPDWKNSGNFVNLRSSLIQAAFEDVTLAPEV